MLNLIQGLLNKFIWGYEKLRVKQNKLSQGRLAAPNIIRYYHAALLTAITQWWQDKNIESRYREQINVPIILKVWILLTNDCHHPKLKGNTMWIYNTLIKVWHKFQPKVILDQSPIISFLTIPRFIVAAHSGFFCVGLNSSVTLTYFRMAPRKA